MEPILLATDYTPAARNAGDYAAQLAKKTGTSLVVLHAWSPPVAMGEAGAIPFSMNEIIDSQQAAVNAEADRLARKWDIKAKGIHHMDFAPSAIADEVNAHGQSLVIMGMRKHNAAGRLLGSVATAHIHRENYSVLLIPEDVSYHEPKTILFATDLDDQPEAKGITMLRTLAEQFDATVQVVNVKAEDELWNIHETNTGLRLDKKLAKVKHDWHFPVGDNVREAVLDEAKKEKADWVAVLPHRIPWYEEIFHRSVSRKLAFTVDRPLLILPAK